MKHVVRGLALALCAALCCSPALAAETLKVGGGSSSMENIFKRIKEPFQEKTGITLELVENGAVDAYTGLLNDQLDVASTAMGSLKQWQALVEKSGAVATTQERLVWHLVGTGLVTVYTNKSVPDIALTADQVKGIFTGQIANWREVGGPDAPIVVVLGVKVPALMTQFQKLVLGGAAFSPKAEYVGTASDMKAKVIGTPNSVTIGTTVQIEDERINAIDYPEPEVQISMLWKLNSPKRPLAQTLYEYLTSSEAKKFVLAGRQQHEASYSHGGEHEHK